MTAPEHPARHPLPLDREAYDAYLRDLGALVRADPELTDLPALRAFVAAHRDRFGPRTAQATLAATGDELRTLAHVMVLAALELADLHEHSRAWLTDHGRAMPPWDVTVPRTAQRLITFQNTVYGVVEWEPVSRVELRPGLSDAERRWATALAIGRGERPQWSDEEVRRFAAYLTLGTDTFAGERDRPDEELARRHQVPVEAVRYRRRLADTVQG
ncbi:hypothetical protein [Streptomyces sp. NPDC059909]|uniref:hypothetical protein n=1 Tax=Streptomyces sp. NPDC059909 TaxID=3346998 RepID=UPI00364D75A4